jgi:hypothetical protein
MQATQPVPEDLLRLVQQAAPDAMAIIPLDWAYEDETYNIAVVVPDTVTDADVRHMKDQLIDAVMDWDEAHGTYTLTMVWREREKAAAGVR